MPVDSERLLIDHYEKVYRGSGPDKSDSPEKARTSLVGEVRTLASESPIEILLDSGAGRGIIPRQLRTSGAIGKNTRVITLDRATIPKNKLLEGQNSQVEHIQADGRSLPIQGETVDLVVSSMAADFIGFESLLETHRVLRNKGTALFTFHHPSQIPENVDERVENPFLTDRQRRVLTYQKYLRDNGVLFESEAEIIKTLGEAGLEVEEVRLEQDVGGRQWWFAKTKK